MNTRNEVHVGTLPVRRVLPALALGIAALCTAGTALADDAGSLPEPLVSAERVIEAARSERPALAGDASSAAEASRGAMEALKAERMQNKAPSGHEPSRRGVVAGADSDEAGAGRVRGVTISDTGTDEVNRFDVVIIDGPTNLMLRVLSIGL